MAEVKLTKNELRLQQTRLGELLKYLPTLQLKKAMLQTEVNDARAEVVQCELKYREMHNRIDTYSSLVNERLSFNLEEAVVVKDVQKSYENIAGTEVPYFKSISFNEVSYQLFDTPPWVDSLIIGLRGLVEASVKIQIAQEKKAALEEELRDVSIKVNLFEKILIPRAQVNIRKIKVFLGDQQLAAVSQAKVAKRKIEERKARQNLPVMENVHAD
ncbi:MAG: V-type ATP synthase subunit D [Parachlamydiaceae bacterium]|nr:V-type ATP synthase subunit D [Parachlamydiaceae bacterium]